MNLDSDFGTNGEAGPDLTVKVFDFFSGCGRASSGFQDAGTDVVFGRDCDADAEQSFKRIPVSHLRQQPRGAGSP